jgi:ubiquinone/menaquinone biosynthesis C-methylase UbiE
MSGTHSYGQGVSGFDRTFGQRMREFVPSLVRLARVAPGDLVLDIATGTGNAAEAAAAAVGPSGHVTAADDTPAMIEQARKRLGSLPNVTVAIEQATALTFADASFDVVLCSMALMIFPDRARALSGFHRVMRQGGRLSVSINTRPERSLTGAVRMAVARHVPSIAEAMAHHYSLNNAARLRALLEDVGLRSVETVPETRAFAFPSFDAYFEPFEQGGGPWGAAYARLNLDARNEVRDDVRRILRRNTGADGVVTVEADILFGCGTK